MTTYLLQMKFGIFNQYGAKNSPPVFEAFCQGLGQHGLAYQSHDHAADVAVIWSMVWSGRMRHNQHIWETFRQSGRPVIVLEVGALRRGHTWKMGVNGTGLQSHWGYGVDINRVNKLGLNLQPWRTTGDSIMIALQRQDSEQWRNMPTATVWLADVVQQLRFYTDRGIRVRVHPRQKIMVPKDCQVEYPRHLVGTYDDFNFGAAIKHTWAVINWNSSLGCQAVLHGVPAFVGPSSLAAPVGNLDLSRIEAPDTPDRSRWLLNLAHTEWTMQEISTGYPVSRLLGYLQSC
jgi:hypothetical protein